MIVRITIGSCRFGTIANAFACRLCMLLVNNTLFAPTTDIILAWICLYFTYSILRLYAIFIKNSIYTTFCNSIAFQRIVIIIVNTVGHCHFLCRHHHISIFAINRRSGRFFCFTDFINILQQTFKFVPVFDFLFKKVEKI